jgi:hypothetical protein
LFCPPLDEALFYAIASEYDLPHDRDSLVDVLDNLKASAIEQENADFDPSGTGGPSHAQDTTNVSRTTPEDASSNGVTSITTGLSDLNYKDGDSLGHELDSATPELKITWLQNVFPDIPRTELTIVLESHAGSLDKATDELLNLSFLNQGDESYSKPKPVLKGIDAFIEDGQLARKGRRKRNRTKDSSRASSVASFGAESDSGYNVWSTMSEDVEYICSRTKLSPQVVRSAYHSSGARLGRTIQALAQKEGAQYDSAHEKDPILEIQLAEFQSQFGDVPKSYMYGLLSLARNIPSATQELLEAMTAPAESQEQDTLTPVIHYTPVNLKEDGDGAFETVTRPTRTAVGSPYVRGVAASHHAAASQSFSQASSAFRKSKSDRLMGGAAAYYSQVGHENIKRAKELRASEADSLVERQSSSTVLDLHGVSVADAVRIASNRAQGWWEGLGDTRYAPGGGGPARAGFRIVTGVGSHSKNHAPKIGPAVSKMLIREGWKVEIGHGELIVTGKARR